MLIRFPLHSILLNIFVLLFLFSVHTTPENWKTFVLLILNMKIFRKLLDMLLSKEVPVSLLRLMRYRLKDQGKAVHNAAVGSSKTFR